MTAEEKSKIINLVFMHFDKISNNTSVINELEDALNQPQIVRCKDCEHKRVITVDHELYGLFCFEMSKMISPHDFCSRAKPKDVEDEE